MSTTPSTASQASAASAPGAFRRLYLGWLELAARFGEVQTQLIVAFVYLFVLGPMAIIATLARQDLLAKRGFGEAKSAWHESDSVAQPDVARAKRLF